MRVHQMPRELISLTTEVTKVLSVADPEWAKLLTKNPINGINVKVYYSYKHGDKTICKKTGWHADVTYNGKTRKPILNNSQIPGSPVALLTFGSTKQLWFQRRRGQEAQPGSLIKINQESGSLFVLDGRDEIPDANGWVWRHMSDVVDSQGTEAHPLELDTRSIPQPQTPSETEQQLEPAPRPPKVG